MALRDDILGLHAADLIAYYPCDDAEGATVADASGNGLNLSVTGSPTFGVAGPSGDGILFNGIDGSPLQSAQGSLGFSELPGAWTVIWFHRRDDPEVVKKYWSISRLEAGNGAVEAFNGTGTVSTDHVRWLVRNDANQDVFHVTADFLREEGEWTMNAMTYDGTTYNYYVDGHLDRQVITTAAQGTVTVTDLTLCGDRHSGAALGRGTECVLQHWAMWSRGLTWREIRDLYYSACADDGSALLAYLSRSSTAVADPPGGYRNQVLADGADSLYRFNEDMTKGGFYFFNSEDELSSPELGRWDGNTTNSTFAVDGPVYNGKAVEFTSSGLIALVPELGDSLGMPFSIEFWIKGTYQSGRRLFSTRVDAGGSYIRLLWETSGGNTINVSMRDSDLLALPTTRAPWTAADDTWVHVCLVVEEDGATIYLDGEPTSGSRTWTGNFNTGWANFSGETANGGSSFTNQFSGAIAEAAVYRNTALTQEQIDEHIAQRNEPPPASGGAGMFYGVIGSEYF